MNWQSAVQITKGESTKRRRRLRGQGSQAASGGQAGHAPYIGAASLPRPTGTFVGRASELAQLERSLSDVPVAVICGVAGVGKSTLALAYGATWPGPAAYLKLTEGTSIPHITEAVYRRLGVVRSDLSLDDAERLEELWGLIDGVGALLVLDDLHGLDAASRSLVVDSATRRLRAGRLITASRELLPVAPGAPDRLQLRLEGLRRDDAAQLWNRLKDLYGAGSDFEVAWRRSLGNPYLLRQGHVATLTGDHPLLAIARGLDREQRRTGAAVALSHVPLPRSVLLRIPGTAASTLEQLVTRLIIDATADAEYAMHDLMREAILQDVDSTTLDEVRAELVDALPGGELDAVTVMQESARHLRALGRHADVATLLVRTSAGLIRQGATTALLHELDAVPVEARGPELQLLRARTLARSILQTRRAYEELQPLAERADIPPVTRYFFATAATMNGQLDEAETSLRALQSAEVAPELRAKADYGLAWVSVYRGQLAAAIELAELRERTAEPRGRVHWMTLRMFALSASGDDQAAADLASRLTELVETELVDHRSHLFTPGLCCVMLARAGRLEEAEHARRLAERGVRRPEDSAELGWIGMMIRGERGERGAALEYYRGVQRIMDRSGYLVGMVWTRAYLGRLLLLHGWRREGLSMLAEGLAQCRAKQALGLTQILERAFDDDPLPDTWLGRDDAVPPAKLGDVIRAQVRTVLRLACTGDRPLGAEHIGATIPATADYAFDRALLELASAVLASRQGRRRLAMSHLQHAISEASGCAADPDLIPAMFERLRVGVVVGSQANAVTRPPPLLIDCTRHEITDAGVRVVLTSRVVLRRLLYAFIVAPERYLDRTAIARVLWNTEYAPLRHDSSIKSNIWRLREIVEGTRVVIQTEKDGYRLSVPADTTIVAPE